MINRETWRPRIVFLWSRLPAYAFACLNQLRTYLGDHMKIYSIGDPPKYFQSTSPWQNARIEVLPRHVVETSQLKKITSEINSFHPDFAFLTGWSIPLVRQLAPRLRTQNVRTICMADTPWMGQVRQIIRAGIGRNMIHRWFDAIWVPGERARYLAEFAGFPSERIWMNLYCADFEKFNEAYRKYGTQRENTFIFTGRLEKVKNIAAMKRATQIAEKIRTRPEAIKTRKLTASGINKTRAAPLLFG